MKYSLKISADVVFFTVLALAVTYFLSDVFGVFHFGRSFGGVIVRTFMFGAPVSLFLSTVCFFMLRSSRFKWYTLISGLEVGIIILVFWVMYRSQI